MCGRAELFATVQVTQCYWSLVGYLRNPQINCDAGVKIAFWTGHEDYAMYTGSTWFVDNFWDDLRENCVAYRVVDTQGLKGRYTYLCTYAEAVKFQNEIVRQLRKEEPRIAEHSSSRKYGDQSLYGLGVTMFYERTTYDPASEHAAGKGDILSGLGWQMHDPEDTPDKVDMDTVLSALQVYLVSVLRLCNAPVLPYEFVSVADNFIVTLSQIQEKGCGIIDCSQPIEKAKRLRLAAGKLEERIIEIKAKYEQATQERTRIELEEQIRSVNKCLMRLSRIYSPVYYTKLGKYDQDPASAYGTEAIPNLHAAANLSHLLPGTDDYETLKTKLVREKNKVSDALYEMIDLLQITLDGTKP